LLKEGVVVEGPVAAKSTELRTRGQLGLPLITNELLIGAQTGDIALEVHVGEAFAGEPLLHLCCLCVRQLVRPRRSHVVVELVV